MEKNNSKGSLVVGILIGIIIMLLIGIGLFTTNIISFSGDNGDNVQESDNDILQ